MKPTLVIMAAGIGSRYGGPKQIDKIGPNGEILMQYSAYDAVRAGFGKIVFIINPEHLTDIKELCGDALARQTAVDGSRVEVRYVFQDESSLPDWYSVPKRRTKPLGTVHAVLCAEQVVREPFAIINADDFYGAHAFRAISGRLQTLAERGEGAMVGYRLKNTISKNGAVTRGICTERGGMLETVTETYKILRFTDGTIRDTQAGQDGVILDPDAIVSMNLWGFTPWIFEKFREHFNAFLRVLPADDVKKECVLPAAIDELIKSGQIHISVMSTDSEWFGITYSRDKAEAVRRIQKLHNEGVYPRRL